MDEATSGENAWKDTVNSQPLAPAFLITEWVNVPYAGDGWG